jgi:hypothetical protein
VFSSADVLRIQEERIKESKYKRLGRVVWISMELQLDHKPTPAEVLTMGRFDWQDSGPLLAMSLDHADILLPDGISPLPNIPDPLWVPKVPTQEQLENPKWQAANAPMIKQSWLDRPCSTFGSGKETWVVYQPILQVWFRPFGVPTYAHVSCKPQPWTGQRTALLIQPETGKAHFYGGTFEIGSR